MQTIIVFAAVLAVAYAGHLGHLQHVQSFQAQEPAVVLLKETPSNNIGVDGYNYAYELSDGQKREESAQVEFRSSNPEDAVLRTKGSYSYVAPDGQVYSVIYVADENGFQPQGAHLPKA